LAPTAYFLCLLLTATAPAHAQADLTLCEGRGFTLTSTAAGPDALGPITYTWYNLTDPAASFTEGTNAATLTVPAGKPAGTYAYVCEVANSACALTSSSFTVEVLEAPAITTQPIASSAVCSGGTVSLSVVASSATAYQWKKDGLDVTDGTDGNTDIYITASLTANATYTAVVSNGSCSVTSSDALVEVVPVPPTPTLNRSAETACAGNSITFTVSDGNGTYDWGGYFSGSGNIMYTPTTAGVYQAAVRSAASAGGVVCYSSFSQTLVAQIISGAPTGSAPNQCGRSTGTVNKCNLCNSSANAVENTSCRSNGDSTSDPYSCRARANAAGYCYYNLVYEYVYRCYICP
jgi:hypothetical protein